MNNQENSSCTESAARKSSTTTILLPNEVRYDAASWSSFLILPPISAEESLLGTIDGNGTLRMDGAASSSSSQPLKDWSSFLPPISAESQRYMDQMQPFINEIIPSLDAKLQAYGNGTLRMDGAALYLGDEEEEEKEATGAASSSSSSSDDKKALSRASKKRSRSR